MIDLNPIRVWMSVADRLKTALAMLNIRFNLLTVDWWLAAIGALSLIVAVNAERTAPAYWPFAIAGILLVPYIVYMILALFWRPVPFFTLTYLGSPIGDGTYDVAVFGEWDYTYEVPQFIGIRSGRARAFWSAGTITLTAAEAVYHVHAKARIQKSGLFGIMSQEFRDRIELRDADLGLATLLWRRVPAVKVKGDGYAFILALKRKAQHKDAAGAGPGAAPPE